MSFLSAKEFFKVAYELMGELQETCFLGCSSEAVQASPVVFNYAMTQIKDKLLEA